MLSKNFIKPIYCIIFVSIFASFTSHAYSSSSCIDGYVCSNYISVFNAKPKYGKNFEHLEYISKSAKKGGEIKYSSIGTFDSMNPFILKGVSAAGIGMIYDSLMSSTADDIFTKYPLIAERVMIAKDDMSIIFVINGKAKWHDGTPITADDVVFTFNKLITEGQPYYATYYGDVKNVEKIDDLKVRFNFKDIHNRELPLILSELTILPKNYYDKVPFNKTSLEKPLGSSAYEVDKIEAGHSISYKLNDNYWAKDLPINKYRNNFEKVTFDYYRDDTVAVEALKAHNYDVRTENIARNWKTMYESPKLAEKGLVKVEIPHDLPTGMQCFILNLRKNKFKNPKVREALEFAFDYEWTNKTLFYDSYTRTRSYFSNSIYEADKLPSDAELKILNKYKGKIPDSVFTEEYNPPKTDGSGNNRKNLRKSVMLLKEAGWNIKKGKLKNDKGENFTIEFLLTSATFGRIIDPYIKNLEKLGISAKLRVVDPAQYIKRIENFDYDSIVTTLPSSQIPGNELKNQWSSEAADVNGSGNLAGVKNGVVDDLINSIIKAKTKDDLINNVKALDRVLQHNHYVIPHWNIRTFRLVYWDKLKRPEKSPPYGLGLDTWWTEDGV